MNNKSESYDELKARCEDLQKQVAKFLKVEQDLVYARNSLDRDLTRFVSIQAYSQQAMQALSMEEFVEITVESVLETFELECSMFFSYNPTEKNLALVTQLGLDEECTENLRLENEWIIKKGLLKERKVIIEEIKPNLKPLESLGLYKVIFVPFYDEAKSFKGILLGGVTVQKKDFYDDITDELIPSFTVFSQQMIALLQNFESKRFLDQKVQERTEEVMSQKKELEHQKEELQITLDNLKQTQNQLIQSEKMAALGGLVAGVAHEINTPVGISLTAASSLTEDTRKMAELYKQNKISRADFKDYMNTANQTAKLIQSNMERTALMIQSFKQVSVDQSTVQQRKFKLKAYTEDVIRSLYPKLKNRKISIGLDIDKDIELDSFPGAFSQIITNLVLNSLTHGFDEKDKGMIKIIANLDKSGLKLEYTDTGKGIPKENLDKIFEPFFTTSKKRGTGLGLNIVYNLVSQKLNGTIECHSELEKGVKFIIKIPFKN